MTDGERDSYKEAKDLNLCTLTIYESVIDPRATVADLVQSQLATKRLLSSSEVWSLLQHAYEEFSNTGVSPRSIPNTLQRKVLASAEADHSSTNDALKLVRICNDEVAAEEPVGADSEELLLWWKDQIPRELKKKPCR